MPSHDGFLIIIDFLTSDFARIGDLIVLTEDEHVYDTVVAIIGKTLVVWVVMLLRKLLYKNKKNFLPVLDIV